MKINLPTKWLKPDTDPLRFKPKPARLWLILCWLGLGLIGILIVAHTILFILWSEPIAEETILEDVADRHQVNVKLLEQVAAREAEERQASTTPILADPGLPASLRAKLGE